MDVKEETMCKLIKLEWKKNNVLKYIRNAAITTTVLLLLLLMAAGELETEETVQSYGKSMLGMSVGMFVHVSYIVFTGVMIAAYIVGAYEKKTINLMYSYPIKRSKIILSKIGAVWLFNFAAMVVSKAVIYLVLIASKPLRVYPPRVLRSGNHRSGWTPYCPLRRW